jgi:spore germination protein KB
MNEKPEKISSFQFGILIFLFAIGSSILLTPAGLATAAKQDAWIACSLGVAMALLIISLYSKLGVYFPNMTLVEYSQKLLGKWIGTLVMLSFVFFCFVGAATVLFYEGEFVVTHIMPETPIQMINGLFAIIIVMGTRLGIETFARTAEILVPWVVMIFFILVATLFPQIEFKKVIPLFESGVKPIIKGALTFVSIASLPCIVFGMVIPSVNKPKNVQKTFIVSILLSGLVMVIITFLCISVLGADITARSTYPSFILAKNINIGHFFQRVEALITGIWVITVYFKILLYFYACVLGTAQILRLKSYQPVVVPLGMLLVLFSLIVYPNTTYAGTWDSTIWIPFVLTFGFVLPLLLLGIAKMRIK